MDFKKKDIIIVTDPGVDDAIAIMYGLFCDELNIKLLAIAGGNGPIENATANACYLMDLFKENIPIAVGPNEPLKRDPAYAFNAQGKDGLGGLKINKKMIKTQPIKDSAADAMFDVLRKSPEKMTIVALGPMMCLADMFKKHPSSKKYIEQIVVMGGTKEKIVGKPYREFNVAFDPESTDIVLRSGVPIVLVPMELGHMAYLDKEEIARFKNTNKIGALYAKMFSKYNDFHVGKLGAAVHDVCAVYYLTDPDKVKLEECHAEVKYYDDTLENYGYIETDYDKAPNMSICVDIDIDDFKDNLFYTLGKTSRLYEKCEKK